MKADVYLIRDLRQRIGSGLIRYRDEVYIVYDLIKDDTQIMLTSIEDFCNGNGKTITVSVNDEDLDVTAIELGYVNIPKQGAYYLSRGPDRRYRQLTCPDNLEIYSPFFNRVETRNLNRQSALYNTGTVDMFKNKYPSIAEAIKSLNSDSVNSVAVSRDVALTVDAIKLIRVFLKDMQIGYIEPNQTRTVRVIVPESEYGSIMSEFLYGYDWRVE